MKALSPAIRSGPAVAVLVALALAPPAFARDANASHHYTIYGSLTRTVASTDANGAMQLQSHLSRATSNVVEQSGEGFVLTARLADQPDVCGTDTIFTNGFDP